MTKTPVISHRGHNFKWCGRRDLNPHGYPPDPKSGASANSATPAYANISISLLKYIITAALYCQINLFIILCIAFYHNLSQ